MEVVTGVLRLEDEEEAGDAEGGGRLLLFVEPKAQAWGLGVGGERKRRSREGLRGMRGH